MTTDGNFAEQKIRFAEFEFDAARRRLARDGEPLALYAKTCDLLAYLLANNGRVVAKNEILDAVWPGQFVEEANLSVQISALRKALGEKKDAPRFLLTVPGVGYKFVAECERESGEIVIEKHRSAQITIEREAVTDEERAEDNEENAAPAPRNLPARLTPTRIASLSLLKIFVAGALCLAAGAAVYVHLRAGAARPPFEKIRLARLTNSGRVTAAALAPDGKYFAYVLGEAEGNSLWIQQTGTASNLRLLAPVRADFLHLAFSPDGRFVYYNLFAGDKTDNELYRIPSLGGVVESLPGVIAHGFSFAPDGRRMSYVQADSANNRNYLVVADADGKNQKIIAAREQPNTFVFPGDFTAWSPDGARLAAVVSREQDGEHYASIALFDLATGAETPLSAAPLRHLFDLEWQPDGSGLLVAGRERGFAPNHVWFVPLPEGEARRVTNDLNSYFWIDVADDGRSFVAQQNNTHQSLYVGAAGSGAFREIAREVGVLAPLAFTPDGELVFRSAADGEANLWKMNAQGGNRRQLTTGAQADFRGLCATPDGRYLVFVSWRNGRSNLWRVDADGRHLMRLTDGEADAYPACTPDSKTVIYQKGILTRPELWKVSIEGGAPVRVTNERGKWAAVSADGRRVSFLHMVDDKWRFGFVSPEGVREAFAADVPVDLRESFTHWSRDGKSLLYIATVGDTGNIRALPLDGGAAVPLTNFESHQIVNFAVAPDGRTLAVTRTISLSDVVLVTETKD